MNRRDFLKLFNEEKRRFSARFPHCSAASVKIVNLESPPGMSNPTERNVAWCFTESAEVFFLARALRLSRQNVVALVRHELAHIANPNLSEHETDILAYRVGGRRIRYDSREIQTIDSRAPHSRRPSHLPK